MRIKQEKSICCHAKIIRFGGKRRQCTVCRKTWSIYPSKRGRKSLRRKDQYLQKVFCQGFSVRQLTSRSFLSQDAIYKRFNHTLDQLLIRKRTIRVKGKQLILVTDALWQYFNGNVWTLYCVGVKSTVSSKITFFDPILKPEKESASTWKSIFDQLPPTIRIRVCALVTDGLRGIGTVATDNGWIIQRCHFHLLSLLQKMRGKRSSTPGRLIREKIYYNAKLALTEKSKRRLKYIYHRLDKLSNNPLCPYRMKMATKDFLRCSSDFRSYLNYSQLNLPTTTNVMESLNSLIRRRARTVNSPEAWLKWAIAAVRFKSLFTCKCANYQQNYF